MSYFVFFYVGSREYVIELSSGAYSELSLNVSRSIDGNTMLCTYACIANRYATCPVLAYWAKVWLLRKEFNRRACDESCFMLS